MATHTRRTKKPTRRTLAGRTSRSRWAAAGLEKRKLRPIEAAILKTLPQAAQGISFDDLVDKVAKRLNPILFPLRKTVSRYTKLVQLDLERRGLIERVPGVSPLRLRRSRKI